MAESTIRKAETVAVSVPAFRMETFGVRKKDPNPVKVYEEVKTVEKVEKFTIEQIDAEIASHQKAIEALQAKKDRALALEKEA